MIAIADVESLIDRFTPAPPPGRRSRRDGHRPHWRLHAEEFLAYTCFRARVADLAESSGRSASTVYRSIALGREQLRRLLGGDTGHGRGFSDPSRAPEPEGSGRGPGRNPAW